MLWIAATLLLQGFEVGPVAPPPCPDPMLVAASRTGRFVVVAEAKKLHVLDGETLKPVHAIDFECTAVGFDAKDETLSVVGGQLVRFETKGWKETFRADLPDVGLLTPRQVFRGVVVDLRRLSPPDGWVAGQAAVEADGAVYYRVKGGFLSVAREREGKLVAERLVSDLAPHECTVDRILAVGPEFVIVQLDRVGGLAQKGHAYTLAGSVGPLAAGVLGGELGMVTKESLNTYSTRTWKNLSVNGSKGNESAVFDGRRGRFLIADAEGLRSWDGKKDSAAKPIDGITGKFRGLSLDGAGARLYALDDTWLRCWRLKD
jgi:hypothetical protein